MANGTWNNIPLRREPGPGVSLPSNVEGVPENCPHIYNENGDAIFYAWPAGVGDPPVENQAPGSHAQPVLVWGEPKVAFDSSGVCTSAGYAPGNVWYNVGDQSGSPSGNSPVKTAAIAALGTLASFLAKTK